MQANEPVCGDILTVQPVDSVNYLRSKMSVHGEAPEKVNQSLSRNCNSAHVQGNDEVPICLAYVDLFLQHFPQTSWCFLFLGVN